jgi:signal peptidase I
VIGRLGAIRAVHWCPAGRHGGVAPAALFILPLALILTGCVSASVGAGQTAVPKTPATPVQTPTEPTCDAPGAGTILEMSQSSMEPALSDGDRFLAVPGTPAAGDIVTFMAPATWFGNATPLAKRVIGVTGDSIEVRDGAVYRNGAALDEPYTFRDVVGVQESTEAPGGHGAWTVPVGQLFVMGDHRRESADSRVFGSIDAGSVTGIVTWRCSPTTTPLR